MGGRPAGTIKIAFRKLNSNLIQAEVQAVLGTTRKAVPVSALLARLICTAHCTTFTQWPAIRGKNSQVVSRQKE
jgi:hypothetical protein